MAKKLKNQLADDIRASWEEALKYARGEKTGAVVHTVIPSASKARKARQILGIEPKPKAVKCALKKEMAS